MRAHILLPSPISPLFDLELLSSSDFSLFKDRPMELTHFGRVGSRFYGEDGQ